MRAVLISIQPYWVFLIIAKKMGWNINQEKTIEVRKNYSQNGNWDKVAKIYCSKDKKSFAKIPKEYQPLMERLLGKVIGEFVCNKVDRIAHCGTRNNDIRLRLVDENLSCKGLTCEYLNKCKLSYSDIEKYSNGWDVYGWHISNLVIYDKPRKLSEFIKPCENNLFCEECAMYSEFEEKCHNAALQMKRPPQSWCYVEKGA